MLVIGPWYHGQWWFEPGTAMGNVQLGSETSTWYHENVELPFYNCLLKGRCDRELARGDRLRDRREPVADLRQLATERASCRRRSPWRPGGTLCAAAPARRRSAEDFVSDPAKPVPYIDRVVGPRYQRDYMRADQRFASRRPDVLDLADRAARRTT